MFPTRRFSASVALSALVLGLGAGCSREASPTATAEPPTHSTPTLATDMNNTAASPSPYAGPWDLVHSAKFAARDADWRNGALVYQVLVDRFAPPENLEAKRALYPPPKKLRTWDEVPKPGTFNEQANVWSHEIDFWGGDLASLRGKLGYLQSLGVDVVYLNPIHKAYTNHKYDAQDYFAVSEEFGTRDDVRELAKSLHERGMRLMLDGVFNHMGRTSPAFQEAMKDPKSPWREWFFIGPEYTKPEGYRGWVDVPNLPELRLENPKVRARLWGDANSVVQGYIRDGVDGWRLDVAFDIGPTYLDELTRSAHAARPDSLIIGEIWNYPEQWFPAIDGIMNMTQRELILDAARGQLAGPRAARMIEQMVLDCDYEHLLKSWVILDNHDTPRLRTSVPDEKAQRIAQVLQMTLPGSPCIYYGVEVGMEGGGDPEMRGPMRWDLANDQNPQFVWTKKLLDLRRNLRALRVGDFRRIESDHLLAFARLTERAEDTVLVVVNATALPQSERLMLRDSKFMSYTRMKDALGGEDAESISGLVTVKLPPRTAAVFVPEIRRPATGYSAYKRVQ